MKSLLGFLGGVFLAAWFVGCNAASTGSPADPNDSTAAPIPYLALGDSYTIGESVSETERWPVQLAAKARKSGIPLQDPVIIARTGWTTGDLTSAIKTAPPGGPFGLVTLLIGVNNQCRGQPLEQYKSEFEALLEQAIEFAGHSPDRVLVVSIPDWGASFYADFFDREAIAKEIDDFNEANRKIALAHGVRYADVTPASRKAQGDSAQFASDGLHPSGSMYSIWTDSAMKALFQPFTYY